MTTIGFYFPNQITKEEANNIRRGFSGILAEMGITSQYHQSSTHGSPGLGLAMIAVYIGLMPDEPYDRLLIEQLRRLAELYKANQAPVNCDQTFVREVGQELEVLAGRLEQAIAKRA